MDPQNFTSYSIFRFRQPCRREHRTYFILGNLQQIELQIFMTSVHIFLMLKLYETLRLLQRHPVGFRVDW
jgi:hypothetical protein